MIITLSIYCKLTCLWLYWTVLSDPVKRREYDKNGMLYAYDYDIIVSNIFSSPNTDCVPDIECFIFKSDPSVIFDTFIFVCCRIILTVTRALYWHAMASEWSIQYGKVNHTSQIYPSSASRTVFLKYLALHAMLRN